MFQVGELVLHSGLGVCRVEEIRRERFPGTAAQSYYVLRPVFDGSATVSYLPVTGTKVRPQRLLTAEEIGTLLCSLPRDALPWVENDMQRREEFGRILREGDRRQLLQMILLLHERQKEKQRGGKRLHTADENALHSAERLIHQEFACSLQIPQDEVAPYIMAQLGIPS